MVAAEVVAEVVEVVAEVEAAAAETAPMAKLRVEAEEARRWWSISTARCTSKRAVTRRSQPKSDSASESALTASTTRLSARLVQTPASCLHPTRSPTAALLAALPPLAHLLQALHLRLVAWRRSGSIRD